MVSGISSVNGFQARMINNFVRAERAVAEAKLRQATGKRINSPADDPSGFRFVSQQRAHLASLVQAKTNTAKAQGLGESALTAMEQISDHLLTIRSNTQAAMGGGLSQAELETKQLEIDDALDAIDSLVSSTRYGGKKLLAGGTSTTPATEALGINNSQVQDLDILKTDPQQPTQTIDVDVQSEATQASLLYKGDGGQEVKEDATFMLTGNLGSESFSVLKDDSLVTLRDAINAVSGSTGVTASLNGDDMTLTSTGYGSTASVEVVVTSGTFDVEGGNGNGLAFGTDAVATINGDTVVAEGNTYAYRGADLEFDLAVESGFGTGPIDQITILNTTKTGEADYTFQLGTDVGGTVNLEIASLSTDDLGGALGSLSDLRTGSSRSILNGGAALAFSIADESYEQVTTQQARLGSFMEMSLDSAMNVLTSQEQTVIDSISAIEDANMAEELAKQTKYETLAETALSSLIQGTTSFPSLSEVFQLVA